MERSETGSTAATEIGAPEGPQAQAAPAAAQRQDVAAPENGGPKLSFQPRLRKACDLCHEGRLRCVMTKNGKCEQCIVRGFNCILRVEKKRGRPRLDEATIAERVARSAADRAHQSYLYNSSGALGNVPAYPCSAMVPSNSGHLTTMPPGYQGSAMAMPGQPNLPLLPPQLYGDPYCFQPGVYGAVSFQRGAFPAGFQPAYMHLPSSAAGLAQNPQALMFHEMAHGRADNAALGTGGSPGRMAANQMMAAAPMPSMMPALGGVPVGGVANLHTAAHLMPQVINGVPVAQGGGAPAGNGVADGILQGPVATPFTQGVALPHEAGGAANLQAAHLQPGQLGQLVQMPQQPHKLSAQPSHSVASAHQAQYGMQTAEIVTEQPQDSFFDPNQLKLVQPMQQQQEQLQLRHDQQQLQLRHDQQQLQLQQQQERQQALHHEAQQQQYQRLSAAQLVQLPPQSLHASQQRLADRHMIAEGATFEAATQLASGLGTTSVDSSAIP